MVQYTPTLQGETGSLGVGVVLRASKDCGCMVFLKRFGVVFIRFVVLRAAVL